MVGIDSTILLFVFCLFHLLFVSPSHSFPAMLQVSFIISFSHSWLISYTSVDWFFLLIALGQWFPKCIRRRPMKFFQSVCEVRTIWQSIFRLGRSEHSLSNLWGNLKHTCNWTHRRNEGNEGRQKILGEIMVEIFSKWKLQTHGFMQVNELYPHWNDHFSFVLHCIPRILL